MALKQTNREQNTNKKTAQSPKSRLLPGFSDCVASHVFPLKTLPTVGFCRVKTAVPPPTVGGKNSNLQIDMTPSEPKKNKGGRRPSKIKHDQQITVLLTKLQKLAVKKRAEKAGLNMSDYCRQIVMEGKAQVKRTPEENEVLYQVARVGNNLNQIAHKANADGMRSIAIEANRLLKQLGQILDKPAEP